MTLYGKEFNSVVLFFRSDFMTLPFQGIECYMANITPLQGKRCVVSVSDKVKLTQ